LRSTFAPVSRLIWAGFFNDRGGFDFVSLERPADSPTEAPLRSNPTRIGPTNGPVQDRERTTESRPQTGPGEVRAGTIHVKLLPRGVLAGTIHVKLLPRGVSAGTIHVKTGPAERHRGVSGGQFSGLLHFATDRTLSGWTLLFAMGKHTSKEFLHGRKHSRISKRPKTRSKSGTKSGLKTGPSRCPKHRKHRYTGKSSFKRGVKMELENATNRPPNERSNARAKSHSERWVRDRILVRRGLDKRQFGGRI
jgi:hypothetical protein